MSLFVKLILASICLYLMFQRDSYQIFDRSPISAVTIKVKHASECSPNASIMSYFPNYQCDSKSLFDVNDFILPAIENSAVSITTRLVETEFILKPCQNATKGTRVHRCDHPARCILPPFYRSRKNRNQTSLCWIPLPVSTAKINYPALDYILFIKHFIEFPHLSLVRHNLLSDTITKEYLHTCEYDPRDHPLCPKFRLLKILQLIENDPNEYERMFFYGSLIEIQISWKCNLDRRLELCEPVYEFRRLDLKPYEANPYDPGSNYHLSKHFFQPNDRQLHRIHTKVHNLRITVSVTGEAGRFDLFLATTSIGSFLGIFGTGSIVCDLLASFITNFRRVKYDQ